MQSTLVDLEIVSVVHLQCVLQLVYTTYGNRYAAVMQFLVLVNGESLLIDVEIKQTLRYEHKK